MMRWNAGLAAAVLAAGLAGCQQKCFMTEADFCTAQMSVAGNFAPKDLECNPHYVLDPAKGPGLRPSTVDDPDRKIRYVALAECIATALEQGNTGSQSALFPGVVNDGLVQFNGNSVGGSDAIRVLSLETAITGAQIDRSLSRFDARWITSLQWQKVDNGIVNALTNLQNGDLAQMSTGIYKPLPTGGLAGITLSDDYQSFTNPPTGFQVVNPSYRPRAQFVFEQPLWRDFGVEINQLSQSLPSSALVPAFSPAGGRNVEGIVITRLRFDQQRAEFERNVNFLLLNVEYAYWNLYGAYYTLYSREQGMRQALVSWQVNKLRFDAGQVAVQDLEQTRAQFELFRAQRITALGKVLDNERQLRGLMGLPIEDGTRLVPSDTPTLALFTPDWTMAENEAMASRPELILARQDLKFRQLDILIQKNLLKPELRFFANYDINGIGTKLDGTEQNGNALANLTSNVFNSWTMGLRMDVPIGSRDAQTLVRQARLNLLRSYYTLKDQEDKTQRFLALQYRNLIQYYREIEAQRAQREANARQLSARFNLFRAGSKSGSIDVLLEAQRNFADSLASEYAAIVNYNNALCGFQFAKGTILPYDNVCIAEGPLPGCVQVRAVEHIRERQIALHLRERADPAICDASSCGGVPQFDQPQSLVGMPVMQAPGAGPASTTPAQLPMPKADPAVPGKLPEGR
ncbi:MAG: TolC family protein [Gemmataceae bacterium]